MSTTFDEHQTPMGKPVLASLIGTTIEWYDFFLYGSAAALVFNELFFPQFDRLVGTLLAFLTFAVGFFARPLGGLVFGHFGDLVGRKQMLVISLVLMGVATVAIGLLPTYATVGVAAPLLLVACRTLQGFAVGGEWGGAVLILAERGDARRRGFWSSWPHVGVPLGQVLASGVLLVFSATMSDATFLSWGWRVPFLLSAVLILVGLWVRISLTEAPVFKQAQERAAASGARRRFPAVEAVTRYPREVLITMGARVCENISGYIIAVFAITYGTEQLGYDRSGVLAAIVIGSIVHAAVIPGWAALSDRVGRRPLIIFGAAGVGVWAFVLFPLMDTGSLVLTTLAITVAFTLHGAIFGPQPAFITELFGTSVRYSGASIGVQFAGIFAGGLAPFIAVALLARFDSSVPVSVYVLAGALVTILALVLSRETARRDLDFERGEAGAQRAQRQAPTAESTTP